ncbi:MAG: hypothetical protein JXA57_19340 [Armatimonadetes bacterium]|nr:hypothetical protein [Armatimonadota bacterium]
MNDERRSQHDSLLGNLGPKLSKLVALLGSDQEGEQVAAVEAMRRVLARAGLDFNDLAAAVGGEAELIEPPIAHTQRPPVYRNPTPPAFWNLMATEILALASDDDLNETERAFLDNMTRWWGGASEKQLRWLDRLHEQVLGVTA